MDERLRINDYVQKKALAETARALCEILWVFCSILQNEFL